MLKIYTAFGRKSDSEEEADDVIIYFTKIDPGICILHDLGCGFKGFLFVDNDGNEYVFESETGWYLDRGLEKTSELLKRHPNFRDSLLKAIAKFTERNSSTKSLTYSDFFEMLRESREVERRRNNNNDVEVCDFGM